MVSYFMLASSYLRTQLPENYSQKNRIALAMTYLRTQLPGNYCQR